MSINKKSNHRKFVWPEKLIWNSSPHFGGTYNAGRNKAKREKASKEAK
jgi:hypothetical protein